MANKTLQIKPQLQTQPQLQPQQQYPVSSYADFKADVKAGKNAIVKTVNNFASGTVQFTKAAAFAGATAYLLYNSYYFLVDYVLSDFDRFIALNIAAYIMAGVALFLAMLFS
jgi:hypothetical protein